MKKVVTVLCILVLISVVVLCGYTWIREGEQPKYQDKTMYLLKDNDMDNCVLVKETFDNKYEVITDTELLEQNKDIFCIKNKGSLYGTTNDGMFSLYKNGERINNIPFWNNEGYNSEIQWGTLEEKFRQVNYLELLILEGAEEVQSDKNYTIIKRTAEYKTSYFTFVHSEDKFSLKDTKLVENNTNITNIMPDVTYASSTVLQIKYGENNQYLYDIKNGKIENKR